MLFIQEFRKVIFSVSYFLFIIVVTAALYSQGALDFGSSKLSKPQAEAGSYGTAQKEIPEIIMPAALEKLWGEFCENNYQTYPIGFLKNVKLNKEEQEEIADIISRITGADKSAVLAGQAASADGSHDGFVMEMGGNVQPDKEGTFSVSPSETPVKDTKQKPDLTVRTDMDYASFKDMMQEADDILGGGSDYSATGLIRFGSVPISYEEALERYHLAVEEDKITGGYARLFSDYASAIAMSVLPVFSAVILCMKDRRTKMAEIIYTRKVSSAKLVLSRYFALVSAAMIPVIILSYLSNISVWGMYENFTLDYLAPLKYDLGWIMPGVMIASAVGMCLTELTNTPVAIAVQGLWWLTDINMGIQSVPAAYALFRLVPRHNAGELSYFRTQDYMDHFNRLAANRLLFAGLSILLIAVTVLIYDLKRKGKRNGTISVRKTFSDIRSRKNKPEA